MLQEEIVEGTPQHIEKKIRFTRNSLRPDFRQTKYATPTLTVNCYLTSMARDGSYENARVNRSRSIRAVAASRNVDLIETPDTPLNFVHGPLKPGMAEYRRIAITFVYVQLLNEPPITADVVSTIVKLLCVPHKSRSCVLDVLHKIISSKETGEALDFKRVVNRPTSIVDGTLQANVVYAAAERGLDTNDICTIVNYWREANEMQPLFYSTVRRFERASPIIKIQKRKTVKSGKYDAGSVWAVASLAQALQWREQLHLATLDPESVEFKTRRFSPLYIEACAFFDEHHRRVILRHLMKL